MSYPPSDGEWREDLAEETGGVGQRGHSTAGGGSWGYYDESVDVSAISEERYLPVQNYLQGLAGITSDEAFRANIDVSVQMARHGGKTPSANGRFFKYRDTIKTNYSEGEVVDIDLSFRMMAINKCNGHGGAGAHKSQGVWHY